MLHDRDCTQTPPVPFLQAFMQPAPPQPLIRIRGQTLKTAPKRVEDAPRNTHFLMEADSLRLLPSKDVSAPNLFTPCHLDCGVQGQGVQTTCKHKGGGAHAYFLSRVFTREKPIFKACTMS